MALQEFGAGILGHSMTECNQGDRNGGHLIGYGGLISEKANVPVPVATLYGQERNLLQ